MARTALILLFVGMGWLGVGTLFRFQHWPFAGFMLLVSYGWLAIGALLFVIAVIKNKGLTGLLDPSVRKDEGGLPPPSN